MIAWRLTTQRAIEKAFSGQGARRAGGRWNGKGIPLVYAADSLSLAALEVLVHFDVDIAPLRYHAFRVEIPDDAVHVLSTRSLPRNWRAIPPAQQTMKLGSEWADGMRSLALAVPSVIIPTQQNILINPRHPRFGEIRIASPRGFSFDRRLIEE